MRVNPDRMRRHQGLCAHPDGWVDITGPGDEKPRFHCPNCGRESATPYGTASWKLSKWAPR